MAVIDYSVLFDENYTQTLTQTQKDRLLANIGAQPASEGRYISPEEVQKLGGIQAGAEVNVQSNWNTADSNDDSYIQNKPAMMLLTPTDDYISLTESEGELGIGLAISTGTYTVDDPTPSQSEP